MIDHPTIVDPLDPRNDTRRALLAVLAACASELDTTPSDDGGIVLRGHQPLVIAMSYAAFLHTDHAALGEPLFDHHLADGTVLCAYRGIARPRGPITLPAGMARAVDRGV